MKLSIVMPVYDADPRLADTVKQALAVDYGCELELVVSGQGRSAPGSALDAVDDRRVRVVDATDDPVRAAAAVATGDYLVVLDADLRHDPRDIPRLLEPVRAGHATVVYGNRLFGSHSGNSFWYVVGNKVLTTAANVMFNCYLSDLETGYKLMPLALYRSLDSGPRRAGAGADAAITGRLLRRGIRPFEVPVSYRASAGPTPESGARQKRPARRRRTRAMLILLRERLRRADARS